MAVRATLALSVDRLLVGNVDRQCSHSPLDSTGPVSAIGRSIPLPDRPVVAGSDFEQLLTVEVSGHSARRQGRRRLRRGSQVLINRFPTDTEFARDVSLAFAGGDAALQVGDLIGGEGSLAAAVGAALARERDALALSFAQERALKLSERTHHREHEMRHR